MKKKRFFPQRVDCRGHKVQATRFTIVEGGDWIDVKDYPQFGHFNAVLYADGAIFCTGLQGMGYSPWR